MMTSRYARTRRTRVARVPSSLMESSERIRNRLEDQGYRNVSNADVMERVSYIIEKEMGRIESDMRELLKDPEKPWKKKREY